MSTEKIYSIDFRAAGAGQTLTVTITSTDASGWVTLQAAVLQPHLPQVMVLSPASPAASACLSFINPGANFAKAGRQLLASFFGQGLQNAPTGVFFAIDAEQLDANIADVQLLSNQAPLLEWTTLYGASLPLANYAPPHNAKDPPLTGNLYTWNFSAMPGGHYYLQSQATDTYWRTAAWRAGALLVHRAE
jgi:hypothetical protein